MNQQNRNYQKELDKIISALEQKGEKKTLLLHSCCAPCSSYVLEYLSRYFYITVFYYNPNIYPPEEYAVRLQEQKRLVSRMPALLPVQVAVNVSEAVEAPVLEGICALGISEDQVQAGSCVITYDYEEFEREK